MFVAAGVISLGALIGSLKPVGKALGLGNVWTDPVLHKDPGILILEIIRKAREAVGTPLFMAAAAVSLIGVVFISLRLSQRFYRRREF